MNISFEIVQRSAVAFAGAVFTTAVLVAAATPILHIA
ncbi:hypothetical protein FHR23_001322 [Stakelama sediminis]|uniref:Uncharacterized protein n=1 Tax=Stakelama sediminis TaxID=463200 RepID=A0A840YXV3_9SPHN|nr:hypothetical protein [Stakelama sediminis]